MSETDLSGKTHVRVSVPQAITIVGTLAALVASGAIAWNSEKMAREAHERNVDIHLDASFVREHGQPVGKWDMVNRDTAATEALKAFQDQADYAKKRMDAFENELDRRRPKWHP